MGIWSKIKGPGAQFKNPNAVGQALSANIPRSPMWEKVSVAGPGFVNLWLRDQWIEKVKPACRVSLGVIVPCRKKITYVGKNNMRERKFMIELTKTLGWPVQFALW